MTMLIVVLNGQRLFRGHKGSEATSDVVVEKMAMVVLGNVPLQAVGWNLILMLGIMGTKSPSLFTIYSIHITSTHLYLNSYYSPSLIISTIHRRGSHLHISCEIIFNLKY